MQDLIQNYTKPSNRSGKIYSESQTVKLRSRFDLFIRSSKFSSNEIYLFTVQEEMQVVVPNATHKTSNVQKLVISDKKLLNQKCLISIIYFLSNI